MVATKTTLAACGILSLLSLCSYFFISAPEYVSLMKASDVEYGFRIEGKAKKDPENLYLPYLHTRWDPDDTPITNGYIHKFLKHISDPYTRAWAKADTFPPLVNGMFNSIAKEQALAPLFATFKQAREQYNMETRGLCPPKEFKEMYLGTMARGHWDPLMAAEAVSQLNRFPKGDELKEQLKVALEGPGIEGIRLFNGTVTRMWNRPLSDVSQRLVDGFLEMVGSVARLLPDMELALNVEAFPRVLPVPKRMDALVKQLKENGGGTWNLPAGYDIDSFVASFCDGVSRENLKAVFQDGLLGGGAPLVFSDACYVREGYGQTPAITATTLLPIFSDFTTSMHSDIIYPSYDFYSPIPGLTYDDKVAQKDKFHLEKKPGVAAAEAGSWNYLEYQKALVKDSDIPHKVVSHGWKKLSQKSLDNHALLGALQSRSAVLKASRWRTWYDIYSLTSWVSYLPVQLSGNDTQFMVELLSNEHTTRLGQTFASKGRRDVKYRGSRERMELYLYYLLLEYHRKMYAPDECEDQTEYHYAIGSIE